MENLSEQLAQTMSKSKYGDRYKKLVSEVLNDEEVKSFIQDNSDKLDPDAVQHSIAKLYEFVQERNKVKKGEDSTVKGYVPTLTISKKLIDISYVPTEEKLRKMRENKIFKRIHAVAMPKSIKNVSLDDFDLSENEYRINAMEKVTDFISVYTSSPDKPHPGMYLYGEFGVGKTYLMAAMANELAKSGFNVTLVHFPSFSVEMKNSITNNQVSDKLDSIKKSQILILDDIGADSMSSWIRDDILGVILEYRMQNSLTTFFTSNFSMDQFEKEHLSVNTRGDEEPLKAKRIMQRVRFLSREVAMFGKNRRPQ